MKSLVAYRLLTAFSGEYYPNLFILIILRIKAQGSGDIYIFFLDFSPHVIIFHLTSSMLHHRCRILVSFGSKIQPFCLYLHVGRGYPIQGDVE